MKRKINYLFLTIVLAMTMSIGMAVTSFAQEQHDLTVKNADGTPAVEGEDYWWSDNCLTISKSGLTVSGNTTKERLSYFTNDSTDSEITLSNLSIDMSGENGNCFNITALNCKVTINIDGECTLDGTDTGVYYGARLAGGYIKELEITGESDSILNIKGKGTMLYMEANCTISGNLRLNTEMAGDEVDKVAYSIDLVNSGTFIVKDYATVYIKDVSHNDEYASPTIYAKGLIVSDSAVLRVDSIETALDACGGEVHLETSETVELKSTKDYAISNASKVEPADKYGTFVFRGEKGAFDLSAEDAIADTCSASGSVDIKAGVENLSPAEYKRNSSTDRYTYFVADDVAKTVLLKHTIINPLGEVIDVIQPGEVVDINYGTITTNYGRVESNEGTIEHNFGYAVNVSEGKVLNQYYEYCLDGCTFASGSTESKTGAGKTFVGKSDKTDDVLGEYYVTVRPDEGMIFDRACNSAGTDILEFEANAGYKCHIENPDGSYSFGKLDQLGGIKIFFKKDSNLKPSPEPKFEDPTETFSDVPKGKWYSKVDGPIAYVVAYGIMNGTGDGKTFDPEGDCTREMFVQILYNSEGKPGAGPSNPFKDVKKSWYYDAVTWALANDVTKGTSADTFGIGGKVTREQLAQFLMNYAKKRGFDTSARTDISKFPDNTKVSGWAKEAISWANANGIVNGKAKNGANYLDSKENATRAEAAQMIMNFQKKFGR